MKNFNEIFKPKKITLTGKSKIVDTESGKYVVKKKNKDIRSLYDYLSIRSFNNYPSLIDEYDDNYVYEYLKDGIVPINQKCVDMANLLSSLHYKTAYYEKTIVDDIKSIYELLLDNIVYFKNYNEEVFKKCEDEVYMSPSYYLLIRNRTRINGLISFLEKELEAWYKLAIDDDKERVVYCHNNLTIDHFIDGKEKYFISWDNYTVDSPVLDLINLYKNDFNKYDFNVFLDTYLKGFSLNETEKKLLFLVISIPNVVYFESDEMNNTINVGKFIDYIDKTEKLIRPYYTIEQEE